MSIQISRRLSRALPVAAAALFIHIGSAAAASPQADIQQQMREVLSGTTATHAILHSEPDPASAARSNSDVQAFARQLLLGWSVSDARAKPTKQALQAASESIQSPRTEEDFQSTVRQSLLGESASSRGAF